MTRSKEGRDSCEFCGKSGCSLQVEERPKAPRPVLPFSGQGCQRLCGVRRPGARVVCCSGIGFVSFGLYFSLLKRSFKHRH